MARGQLFREDNSTGTNSSGNFNEPFGYNMNFHSFAAVIIFVFLSCFMGTALYFFCTLRRSTSWADRRSFRVAEFADSGSSAASAQGLERSVIESFPVFGYKLVKGLKSQAMGTECAVCLADFKEHEMLRLLPKCSHAFHPECIDTWLCTNTTCPLCRATVIVDSDSNETSTDFGVVGTQLSDRQLPVFADDGGGVSTQGHDEATIGLAGSDPTGHSLIMVPSGLNQGNEWYIVTAHGLTPGLYRSFSGRHQTSGSLAPPAYSKPGGSAENKSKSERWGKPSINPASFLRTSSMRVTTTDRDEIGGQRQREMVNVI